MNKKNKSSRAYHPLRLSFRTTDVNMSEGKIEFDDPSKKVDRTEALRFQHSVVRIDTIDPSCSIGDIAAQTLYQAQPSLESISLHCLGVVRPIVVAPMEPPVEKFKYRLIAGYRQFQLLSQAAYRMEYCMVTIIQGATAAMLLNMQKADRVWAPLCWNLSSQGQSLVISNFECGVSSDVSQRRSKKELAKQFDVGISTVYQHLQQRHQREHAFAQRATAASPPKVSAGEPPKSQQATVDLGGQANQQSAITQGVAEVIGADTPAKHLNEPALVAGISGAGPQPSPPSTPLAVPILAASQSARALVQLDLFHQEVQEALEVAPTNSAVKPQLQGNQ